MYQAFTSLLNMSLTASVLVLVIILLRPIMKKAPKKYLCILWALVAIRLIVPFSFSSSLSAFNLLHPTSGDSGQIEYFHYTGHTEKPEIAFEFPAPKTIAPSSGEAENTTSHNSDLYLPTIMMIWALGLAAMLIYMAYSYWNIKRQVSASIKLKRNGIIFVCDDIETPFILGVFRPRIYLPSGLEHQDREYVIAHEQAHIKRFDHIWKPLGFILLSVYWFNPVLWLAYILLCRDIESACDEKAIKMMSDNEKAAYSQALLSCAMQRRMVTVCPLAFGEVGVKERVKYVLNYKKPAFWIVISAFMACIIVSICFLTNPKRESRAAGIVNNRKEKSLFEENIDREKQHINLDISNLSIDADYAIPDVYKNLKMNRVEAHLPEINAEKCIELFEMSISGCKKEIDKNQHSVMIGDYESISYVDPDPYDNNEVSCIDFSPFGSYGTAPGYSFDKIYPCVRTDKRFDSYNLDKFSTTQELPFISRKELFNKVKKAFKEGVGINISNSYEGYALEYEIMQKEQKENPELMGPVRDDWSEADNAYYFVLHQEVDGVPIYQQGYGDMESAPYIDETRLEVFYDKNGWISYRALNGYIINKTHEKQQILDIDEALQSLKKKCDLNTESNVKTNIHDIRLELVPVHIKENDYEIRPIWVFHGMMEGYSFGYTETFIDGITGEVLYDSIP